jgi:hypothetical protein
MTITGPPAGWKTKTHKRYITKDRTLLKQLEDACEGGERASPFCDIFLTLAN